MVPPSVEFVLWVKALGCLPPPCCWLCSALRQRPPGRGFLIASHSCQRTGGKTGWKYKIQIQTGQNLQEQHWWKTLILHVQIASRLRTQATLSYRAFPDRYLWKAQLSSYNNVVQCRNIVLAGIQFPTGIHAACSGTIKQTHLPPALAGALTPVSGSETEAAGAAVTAGRAEVEGTALAGITLDTGHVSLQARSHTNERVKDPATQSGATGGKPAVGWARRTHLAETPPRVRVAHARCDAATVAVTWYTVGEAVITWSAAITLAASDPRLATAKHNIEAKHFYSLKQHTHISL